VHMHTHTNAHTYMHAYTHPNDSGQQQELASDLLYVVGLGK